MVGEVEARIKEHDKQERAAVNERLDAIRLLVDGASGRSVPASTPRLAGPAGSAAAHYGTSLSGGSEQDGAPGQDSRVSAIDVAEELAGGKEGQTSMSNTDARIPSAQHRRDVTYVGLGAAFLGAGVVAAVNALFS